MRGTQLGTEAPIRVDSLNADSIDIREPTVGIDDIGTAIDDIAADLRHLWSSALERGDYEEITRLVEASHALHRAAIALNTDNRIAARSSSP